MASLFPIQKQALFQLYKDAMASFWTVNEVDLERDDLKMLAPAQLKVLKTILSFFASSDIIVNDNIMQRFWNECVYAEAQLFYGMQLGIESVHTLMYAMLIDHYFDEADKDALFRGIETNPFIRDKAGFCKKYMSADIPLGVRLVAYACVEGIFFCSSFASIYYFKKKGLLPGLTFSNELIARDESMHARFSCALYKELVADNHCPPVPDDHIARVVTEAVDLEVRFVYEMLSDPMLGFSASMMEQYVQSMGNLVAGMLGIAAPYPATKQPFEFMDLISLQGKTNFFEKRVTEYKKVQHGARVLTMDADF